MDGKNIFRRNKRFNLGELSDEQLQEFMDSVDTDEELTEFGSDDEFSDAVENNQLISQVDEISINIGSNDGIPSTSSLDSAIVATTTEEVPITIIEPSASTHKSRKRMRSPLPSMEDTGPFVIPSNGGFTGLALDDIQKDSKEFSNILWRNISMRVHVNEIAFRGNSLLPSSIKNKTKNTPVEIFLYFFSENIVQMIVEETIRAACAENLNTSFKVDANDIRHYIGILVYMSIYRYPNLPSYWSKNAFQPIKNTMPIKRFMAIRKYLCFQDESQRIRKGQPGYDPLFRIRNIANEVNKQFDSIPKTSRLCVDEQMCSTKMKHHLRQYMPNKPHKWGIKLFVLCDSNGFAYRFEIYNGAGDNVISPGYPDLGATANVVVRLSQTIPNFANHIVYFDNFYTSIPLLVYLRARGIYGLGTVRANRIPNCKLPLDKSIKNKDRGYSDEYVGTAYGVDVTTVLWKDTKVVRLASTYVGTKPFESSNPRESAAKASRYDRKLKANLEVDCPQIIHEYNRHMGGVDLMDGLMGRYHIRAKTRNAMTRLFYHFIDMAVTNAYILHRRIHDEQRDDICSNDNDNILPLPAFREEIAAGLVAYSDKRSVGRPSLTINETQPSISDIGKKSKHPTDDVRFDGYDHFPVWLSKESGKKKCKLCKTSQTQCICQKCNLNLCCSNAKNCFYDYHNTK